MANSVEANDKIIVNIGNRKCKKESSLYPPNTPNKIITTIWMAMLEYLA